ncbi:cell death abnormality protein 1-like [Ruditapes philippinarum]|uniref:cell death abnormality protein 1-like n=1 Tax=Ruditapes philippinarum TaxID=129788 RepID=UPI00295AC32E|nr:cell death abnormality protein 1-like [Ruditapes philippinarum]
MWNDKDCDGNSSGKCQACPDGYFGNKCEISCTNKCLKCFASTFNTSKPECTLCEEGYFLFMNSCVQCSKECRSCNNFDSCIKCKPGFYGPVCTKCHDSCLECTSKDSCTKCKPNFYAVNNCRCSKNCALVKDTNSLCYANGTCTRGCVDGKMGEKCSLDCPGKDKCLACDRKDGRCTKCVAGFYNTLKFCSDKCGRCVPDSNGNTTCSNNTNGYCYGECSDGYFGKKCDENCSKNCRRNNEDIPTCYQKTGNCMNCPPGYYGSFCQYKCNENCIESDDGINICNENMGECQSCKRGYFGTFCTYNCSDNCFDTCDIVTGKCHQCEENFYGHFCEKRCFQNCDTCDQYTGVCNICKSNFYGESCNLTCPGNCSAEKYKMTNKTVCQRETGECLTCKTGFYGKTCDKKCPKNCAKYFSEITSPKCIKSNGRCINCEIGYYGMFCERKCRKTCQQLNNSGKRPCVQTTGRCSLGCINGWHGGMCRLICNATCENRACDLLTGQCSKGCIIGYEGYFCEKKQIFFEPNLTEDALTVNEGTVITDINCRSRCNPVCSIQWTREQDGLSVSKNGTLQLGTVSRETTGVYTCMVIDSWLAKTFHKSISVYIKYGPDHLHIIPHENYLTITRGEQAPLVKCMAECYPPCKFQWTKKNDSSVWIVNDTLQLGVVTWQHSGIYTCTVTNTDKEYPKSYSLSLEIEVTGNEGHKSNSLRMLVLVIGACAVAAAVVIVTVLGVALTLKRTTNRGYFMFFQLLSSITQ